MEAGWREEKDHWQNGKEEFEIEIAVDREVPDLVRLAIGLKIQLSKLKVKVKLRYINSSELAPNAFESTVLLVNCGGDPDVVLWNFWHSGARFNLVSYHNPQVDDLLEWGRNLISADRRKLIYDRVQELIVADHPAAFLCTSVCLLGSNCVLQNASELLTLPDLFPSIKSWTIKRGGNQ
jgi:peptide/nickel transport system substrate-binding protein